MLRNFQDQEKMEEAETVHRQALQAGKQSPSGELLWYVYGIVSSYFMVVYGICFLTYFSTFSKNPAQHPWETCLED